MPALIALEQLAEWEVRLSFTWTRYRAFVLWTGSSSDVDIDIRRTPRVSLWWTPQVLMRKRLYPPSRRRHRLRTSRGGVSGAVAPSARREGTSYSFLLVLPPSMTTPIVFSRGASTRSTALGTRNEESPRASDDERRDLRMYLVYAKVQAQGTVA